MNVILLQVTIKGTIRKPELLMDVKVWVTWTDSQKFKIQTPRVVFDGIIQIKPAQSPKI